MNTGFIGRLHSPYASTMSGNSEQIWKLALKKGEEVRVAPLGDLTGGFDVLAIHFMEGKPSEICEGMYPDCTGCLRCGETNKFGNLNTPSFVICFLGYVFDHVGKVRVSKKTGKEYPENPVKIIEIPSGTGGPDNGINLETIRKMQDAGIFADRIWQIKRNELKGMNPPQVIDPALLGNQIKQGIPTDIKMKWEATEPGLKKGIILSAYGNYKVDHSVFKELGIIVPTSLTETPEKAPADASDELDR